jgi:hypothetical protein
MWSISSASNSSDASVRPSIALGFPSGDVVYGILKNLYLIDSLASGHLQEGIVILREELLIALCELSALGLDSGKLWEMKSNGISTMEMLRSFGSIRYLDVAIQEAPILKLPQLAKQLKRAMKTEALLYEPVIPPSGVDPELFKTCWMEVLQQWLRAVNA